MDINFDVPSGDINNNFSKLVLSFTQDNFCILVEWKTLFWRCCLLWVKLCSPWWYLKILTLIPVNVTLFGYRVFVDIIGLIWGHTGLWQTLTQWLVSLDTRLRGCLDSGKHRALTLWVLLTKQRTWGEDESSHWSDVSPSRRTSRVTSNH